MVRSSRTGSIASQLFAVSVNSRSTSASNSSAPSKTLMIAWPGSLSLWLFESNQTPID
jgi:hypothetical protein